MTGGVAPGWYPDYEAPPGHQRYWDGDRWTERRRSDAPEAAVAAPTTGVRASSHWILVAAAGLLLVSIVVVVLADRNAGPSETGTAPRAGTPGPTNSEQVTPGNAGGRRTWQVEAVVDGSTIELSNGAEVRLAGIVAGCSAEPLAKLVLGRQVTLTRRGPDKDAEGRLLRYVERDGVDVGKRLIQKGWATASDEDNARRTIYQRIDERSPDTCG